MRLRSSCAVGLLVALLDALPGVAQETPPVSPASPPVASVVSPVVSSVISPVVGGLEAFFTGDTQTAGALLKAHVFSADDPDPWALYALGVMQRDGKGAAEDRVLACAYFSTAAGQFARQSSEGSTYDQMANHAFEATCSSLAADELAQLNLLLACPHDGPPPGIAALAPQQWVIIERTRWKVTYEGEERTYPLSLPGCRSVVLPVAHAELARPGVPPGDPSERRFLQYFVWAPGRIGSRAVKQLFWIVEEVRTNRLVRVVTEPVYAIDDQSYQITETAGLAELAQLAVTPSGDIVWTIATEPPRSGVIPIPIERTYTKP